MKSCLRGSSIGGGGRDIVAIVACGNREMCLLTLALGLGRIRREGERRAGSTHPSSVIAVIIINTGGTTATTAWTLLLRISLDVVRGAAGRLGLLLRRTRHQRRPCHFNLPCCDQALVGILGIVRVLGFSVGSLCGQARQAVQVVVLLLQRKIKYT